MKKDNYQEALESVFEHIFGAESYERRTQEELLERLDHLVDTTNEQENLK
jgi:hypothetical protein